MSEDDYTRPERATELRLARRKFEKRYKASVQKLGLCSVCKFGTSTFGIHHCRLWLDRRHPQCERDGKAVRFEVDAEKLEQFKDAA